MRANVGEDGAHLHNIDQGATTAYTSNRMVICNLVCDGVVKMNVTRIENYMKKQYNTMLRKQQRRLEARMIQ